MTGEPKSGFDWPGAAFGFAGLGGFVGMSGPRSAAAAGGIVTAEDGRVPAAASAKHEVALHLNAWRRRHAFRPERWGKVRSAR